MNIRSLTRWAGITVTGLVSTRVALLVVPQAAIGLFVGVALIGVMVFVIIRGARACARGDLETTPLFEPRTPPGGEPNARVQTRTRADAQARAREAA